MTWAACRRRSDPMPRVTLIGYRGTGKSTVAALLGEALGCGWCDADATLERKLGVTIAKLVRDAGEPRFRDEEETVLAELLEGFPGVVATGGGVVLRPANRALLRRAGRPIVWLTATAAAVRRRLAVDPTTADRRPALTSAGGDPLAEVEAMLEHREPLYRECADVRFDTSAMPPDETVARIVSWLEDARAVVRENEP